jgi:hypothetical protein
LSGVVVRTTLPRRTPLQAQRFINRSTVQRATGDAFAVHLLPDLVGSVDLHVGLPDALECRHQVVIRLARAQRNSGCVAGCMAPIADGAICKTLQIGSTP